MGWGRGVEKTSRGNVAPYSIFRVMSAEPISLDGQWTMGLRYTWPSADSVHQNDPSARHQGSTEVLYRVVRTLPRTLHVPRQCVLLYSQRRTDPRTT